jgi:hypothetical protein
MQRLDANVDGRTERYAMGGIGVRAQENSHCGPLGRHCRVSRLAWTSVFAFSLRRTQPRRHSVLWRLHTLLRSCIAGPSPTPTILCVSRVSCGAPFSHKHSTCSPCLVGVPCETAPRGAWAHTSAQRASKTCVQGTELHTHGVNFSRRHPAGSGHRRPRPLPRERTLNAVAPRSRLRDRPDLPSSLLSPRWSQ